MAGGIPIGQPIKRINPVLTDSDQLRLNFFGIGEPEGSAEKLIANSKSWATIGLIIFDVYTGKFWGIKGKTENELEWDVIDLSSQGGSTASNESTLQHFSSNEDSLFWKGEYIADKGVIENLQMFVPQYNEGWANLWDLNDELHLDNWNLSLNGIGSLFSNTPIPFTSGATYFLIVADVNARGYENFKYHYQRCIVFSTIPEHNDRVFYRLKQGEWKEEITNTDITGAIAKINTIGLKVPIIPVENVLTLSFAQPKIMIASLDANDTNIAFVDMTGNVGSIIKIVIDGFSQYAMSDLPSNVKILSGQMNTSERMMFEFELFDDTTGQEEIFCHITEIE